MNPNTGGRPEKVIDWDILDELLEAGNNGVDCAHFFHMNHHTLYDKVKAKYGMGFTEYLQSKHSDGKAKILRAQYRKALDSDSPGNVQLLLHLGKVRCGQRDTEEKEQDTLLKELKDMIADAKDNREVPRVNEACRSNLEAEQSILYQGHTRETDQVST